MTSSKLIRNLASTQSAQKKHKELHRTKNTAAFGPRCFLYERLLANVWYERHEACSLDGVLDGALEGCAIAAAFATKELALVGTHLLQALHVLVINERGTRASLFCAKPATILATTPKLLADHRKKPLAV